jgi:uncharacterized protein
MQVAKHWRLKGPRYRLEGARDPQTGTIAFPPPAHGDWQPVTLEGRGTVESWTVVNNPSDGFESGTIVALVRLAEGPLITAQLADVEAGAITIGMEVEMVTRKLRDLGPDGLIAYGYKFRPILES